MDAMTVSMVIGLAGSFGLGLAGAFQWYHHLQTRRIVEKRLRAYASR